MAAEHPTDGLRMGRMRDRRIVLLRRPCLVAIGWGGIAPIVLLGGLFALIGAQVGAPVAAAALVGAFAGSASLLVHELGHLTAARKATGIRPVGVSLMWAGAATTFEGTYGRARDQIRVAVAGPAASFGLAIALIAPLYLPLPQGMRNLILLLALFNATVGVVNLIPVDPLDGYKLVVGLLWSMLGSESSARRLIRRLAMGGLAFEAVSAGVLLMEKPVLGSTSIAIAASIYGQRIFVRRSRGITHP